MYRKGETRKRMPGYREIVGGDGDLSLRAVWRGGLGGVMSLQGRRPTHCAVEARIPYCLLAPGCFSFFVRQRSRSLSSFVLPHPLEVPSPIVCGPTRCQVGPPPTTSIWRRAKAAGTSLFLQLILPSRPLNGPEVLDMYPIREDAPVPVRRPSGFHLGSSFLNPSTPVDPAHNRTKHSPPCSQT